MSKSNGKPHPDSARQNASPNSYGFIARIREKA